jgi:chemotaxis protein methyltransferase CheR
MNIQPFQSLVKEKCGLCFEEGKVAMLADGILARMSQLGMAIDTDYLACLRQNEAEFHSLVNLLTVNETYFFREPEHLNLLADKIMPEMLANKTPGDPVRILCAGCATGEEPYSIMMKLFEKYGPGIRELVSITGVDIDSVALGMAERGVYSGLSFRGFPDHLRHKYFEKSENDHYRVRNIIREKIGFRKMNLLNDPFSDMLGRLDAIFYRNVSIYFDPPTQLCIFNRLAALLREKGWLFVSATETLSHNHGVLPLVERDGIFCFQNKGKRNGDDQHKRAISSSAPAQRKKPSLAPLPPVSSKQRPDRRLSKLLSFEDALALAENKRYGEALGCLDTLLEQDRSSIKSYMLKAGVLINMKRLDDAERTCRQGIERQRWNLEGHLLLGLIAKLKGDSETAVQRFKEAVYIQSSCWLGHFYLAEVYGIRNESKQAIREYEIAIKLLSKDSPPDHGLTFFPLAFRPEQIKHLCLHNLNRLKKSTG